MRYSASTFTAASLERLAALPRLAHWRLADLLEALAVALSLKSVSRLLLALDAHQRGGEAQSRTLRHDERDRLAIEQDLVVVERS
jgi:hypothetical protein